MRTIAAIGHDAYELAGLWRPTMWMPAIDVIRAELIHASRLDSVTLLSNLEAGFPLMAACAALLARDAGHPIRLVAAVPFLGHEQEWEDPSVVSWYQRALERADDSALFAPRPPRSIHERMGIFSENANNLVRESDMILACWNGTRKCRTARAMTYANEHQRDVRNVYPEVARALGIKARSVERPEEYAAPLGPRPARDTELPKWGGMWGVRAD